MHARMHRVLLRQREERQRRVVRRVVAAVVDGFELGLRRSSAVLTILAPISSHSPRAIISCTSLVSRGRTPVSTLLRDFDDFDTRSCRQSIGRVRHVLPFAHERRVQPHS